MSARGKRIRSWLVTLVVLLLLGGAAAGIYRMTKVQASATFPLAPARKGDFFVIVRSRGELKANRSVQVYAPMVPQLRIAWLAASGEMIKEGDPMIKFDSSAAQQQLLQKEAALRQAQASLDQAVAQARIEAEQDKSDLADAQYTVEKAKLEVSKQEIVGKIQADESKIDLAMSEQRLKVQEATVALHQTSARAKEASLTRVRDQAKFDADLTKQRIGQMEIKAPNTGFLVFGTNYTQGWIDAKPFKVGDNVFAGMGLAEIPDLNTLELEGKIEETDRGKIGVGQEVKVHIDSLPELDIRAKVGQISPLAEQSNEFPRTRSFKAWAPLLHPDQRLRPGMNGGMDIIVSRVPNAISIPAKALFTHAGKPVVYVAEKNQYRAVQVEVQARNPDEVAISGVPAGTMIALVDVEKKEQKK
jgi:HlyD family secretion protein